VWLNVTVAALCISSVQNIVTRTVSADVGGREVLCLIVPKCTQPRNL